MLSGKEEIFGSDSPNTTTETYDFSKKIDLLGVHGMVVPSDSTHQISNLGFVVNNCPVRDLLDFEQHHKPDDESSSLNRLV
mmetsp:Transcript_1628/g.2244  ORF Transcript_1628/g.2244 Transcript_1628/m.2244 type:complete len:81 (+) Transcript_1628:316-558(+)